MRVVTILTIGLALLLFATFAGQALAERATQAEMELVCQNWLSYVVYQKGAWEGETRPRVDGMNDLIEGDTVLARCFSIFPRGFVAIPILKELPPIYAYSEEYGMDVNQAVGFPQLLKEVLVHRMRLYAKIYGSVDAVQPDTGDVLLGRENKAEWGRFLKSKENFKTDLTQGKFQPWTEVGPLLTTAWEQSGPYNNFCPMGDGGRCLVGCVATAASQIMKYWNWPPSGTGNHSFWWDGDQSCGHSVGSGNLSATFSDTYDWQNMPNICNTGSPQAQQDAVAELCYEVGVAFNMDYGRCASGAFTSDAITVYPTYFRYDPSIDKEDRDDHTAAEWFSIIQTEINNGRPMQYKISGHSIVCDGWRDTGGQNQYHMNYGWGGPFTTWFAIDNLYCYWEPNNLCPYLVEYLIRNIIPANGSAIVVKPDGTGNYPTIQAAINAASTGAEIVLTNGTFTGNGNRDIDFLGKAITVRSQSGHPEQCIIDCQGSVSDQHRGFYFHSGETRSSLLKAITIKNGYTKFEMGSIPDPGYGGGIDGYETSPTIMNCIISNNIAYPDGGGVSFFGGSPAFDNCTFIQNQCVFGAAISYHAASESDTPTVNNSSFFENYGQTVVSFYSAPVTIANCTFLNNYGSLSDIDIYSSIGAKIRDCIVSGGTGLHLYHYSSGTISNCTFYRNYYGALVTNHGVLNMENTIVAFSNVHEGIWCYDTTITVTLTCCDIYGNAGGDWVSCIADQYGINGNFSANPLFCNPGSGDFHLLGNSSCAPAHQPVCGLIGALGVGCEQAPPVTMPIEGTGVDIPFASGSDTLAVLNFVSENLDYVTIDAKNGTLPPDLPESTNWVQRYYSITPIPEDSSFQATLTLFYDQSEFDVSGLSDESDLGLCRYDTSESTWMFKGGIVDTTENSITLSGVTQFSIWGITDSANSFPMIRGDANRDGVINAGDVVYLVSYLYRSGPAPNPLMAGEVTCDGVINAGDIVYLVSYLYRGGPPPSC